MTVSFKTGPGSPTYARSMDTTKKTSAPQFAFVGLVVSDMAASVAFYRRLGLEFPEGAETQPHVEAGLPGGLLLVLDTEDTVRSFQPDWRAPAPGGRVGIAFRCERPEQVDAVYEELVGAGYHGKLKPWDAFWGQRYATVHDPDGNGVDLLAPLAESATE
jgi:catechol 2,3-dioxygenase-like lactoylglutathione lyase family enzyme